jgi:hypothetical protein
MNGELAKTISTCTIWLATTVILTFGLFKMDGSVTFFMITTGIICTAAVVGTLAIWSPWTLTASCKEAPAAEKK